MNEVDIAIRGMNTLQADLGNLHYQVALAILTMNTDKALKIFGAQRRPKQSLLSVYVCSPSENLETLSGQHVR